MPPDSNALRGISPRVVPGMALSTGRNLADAMAVYLKSGETVGGSS
jgi:hypothetical protein